jgi:hypothetical protein
MKVNVMTYVKSHSHVTIDVQVIALETKLAGVIMPGTKQDIIQYLQAGCRHFQTSQMPMRAKQSFKL